MNTGKWPSVSDMTTAAFPLSYACGSWPQKVTSIAWFPEAPIWHVIVCFLANFGFLKQTINVSKLLICSSAIVLLDPRPSHVEKTRGPTTWSWIWSSGGQEHNPSFKCWFSSDWAGGWEKWLTTCSSPCWAVFGHIVRSNWIHWVHILSKLPMLKRS